DNAGKTTLLYRLKIGEVVTTIPTIGFNVESVTYKNLNFNVWDLGGQTSIRPYWRCYYANTAAVIFVIDSTDIDRLGTASEELAAMLNEDELRDAALLVFANKQDQPGAKGAGDISEALHLGELKDRNWSIVACSAVDGKGVEEGMDWLVHQAIKLSMLRWARSCIAAMSVSRGPVDLHKDLRLTSSAALKNVNTTTQKPQQAQEPRRSARVIQKTKKIQEQTTMPRAAATAKATTATAKKTKSTATKAKAAPAPNSIFPNLPGGASTTSAAEGSPKKRKTADAADRSASKPPPAKRPKTEADGDKKQTLKSAQKAAPKPAPKAAPTSAPKAAPKAKSKV
ncbi:MAG: hypothetical protein L6R42_010879, partial [Xanthoria sp. 1 TBL-2021]